MTTPHRHDVFAKGGRGSCPPHTPLMVEAVEEGSYAARCVRCGLVGPAGKDVLEAKEAFEDMHRSSQEGRSPKSA